MVRTAKDVKIIDNNTKDIEPEVTSRRSSTKSKKAHSRSPAPER